MWEVPTSVFHYVRPEKDTSFRACVKCMHFFTVLSASEFQNFSFIRMAAKRHLEEDEIEKQLIMDSYSNCFTED
jgi:hypothetical protein